MRYAQLRPSRTVLGLFHEAPAASGGNDALCPASSITTHQTLQLHSATARDCQTTMEIEPPGHLANAYQHNASNSPLLARLPAEIRMQIFQHTLANLWITLRQDRDDQKLRSISQPLPFPLAVPGTKDELNNANYSKTQSQRKRILALPLTCRQVYFETHLLPYADNVFHFPTSNEYLAFLIAADRMQKAAMRTIMPPLRWTEIILEGGAKRYTLEFPKLKCVYLDLSAWKMHGGSLALDVECAVEGAKKRAEIEEKLGCKFVVLEREVKKEKPHECGMQCTSRMTLCGASASSAILID